MEPSPSSPPPPPSSTTEIAFFDVETTVPSRVGVGFALLEFGAILVCPRRLVEVGSYSTLIRPANLSAISPKSVRCNGITQDAVALAPYFKDVADSVFEILHGRVWAGHNISRFDCPRIREAFAEIGRPAPEPKGLIDTLTLLTQSFGRRAGDMKMATLASYFGLGKQRHRSLDDVRMNLEVLKYCATILFLESSFSDMYSMNSSVQENITGSPTNESSPPEGIIANLSPPSNLSSSKRKISSFDCKRILEVSYGSTSSAPLPDEDSSDLISHIGQIKLDSTQSEMATTAASSEGCSSFAGFLDLQEVSIQCLSASQVPFHQYGRKTLLFHKDAPLQLCCTGMRVHFGISPKFVDHAGRPKLSIVVDLPTGLCRILDSCDHLAFRSCMDSGSSSEWRPVIKKNGSSDASFARLNIPSAANGDAGIYTTEIFQKEHSGSPQKLVFSGLDPTELESLFVPGTIVDAFFSVDAYDYQNSAGLRLVAKRLIVHPK